MVFVCAVLGWAVPAGAHPLGNFTVNVYSGLRVTADEVAIDLVVDMAEIPAFQARRDVDEAGEVAYAARSCADGATRLELTKDGRRVPLRVRRSGVTFPPGQAGLATLRLSCLVTGATGELRGDETLRYRNHLYEDRVGWREITAVGDGATLLSSDVPAASTSAVLTAYPNDLLQSPLDQRQATLRARPGGPTAGVTTPGTGTSAKGGGSSLPSAFDRATRSFTGLVSRRDLTPAFGAFALGLALLLGGVHALAPGHGKTIMAAYLVGQRGTLRQAALLGLTVTVTHTAGVLILGIVLSTTSGLAPERLYPWLGLASGALVTGIGASLLARARRDRRTRRSVPAAAPLPQPVTVRATVDDPSLRDHSDDDPRHRSHDDAYDRTHAYDGAPVDDRTSSYDPADDGAPVDDRTSSYDPAGDGARPGGHTHDDARDPTHPGAHTHADPDDHPHRQPGDTHDQADDSTHPDGHTHADPHDHTHRQPDHDHAYADTHGHGHDHTHGHGHGYGHGLVDGGGAPLSRRSLLTLGLAGGLVPTPSALVVLLGAIALGRAWFGVVLVVGYGVGMAVTLVGAGVMFVRARSAIEARLAPSAARRLARFTAVLPVVTATVIVAVGVFITLRAAASF